MFTTRALRHIASIAAMAIAIVTLAGAAVLFTGTSDAAAQDCGYNVVAVNGVCPTPTPIEADPIEYKPFTAVATATPAPNNNPVVAATPVPTAAPAAVQNTSPVPQFTG